MLARHPNKFPNGLNTKNSVYSAPSATEVRRPLSVGAGYIPGGLANVAANRLDPSISR